MFANCSNVSYESDGESATSYSSDDCFTYRNVRKRLRPSSSSSSSNGCGGDSDPPEAAEEWHWEDKENVADVKPFVENVGIDALVLQTLQEQPTPLCALKQVLNDDFFEMIAQETNRYAVQMIEKNKTTKGEEWFPVTSDELKVYVSLCIIMSQVKKSCVDMYWSKQAILETPIFSKTMPRKRFLAISHFLHFEDNETMDSDDGLNKIRNVVDYLNDKFLRLYTPNENVAIDELRMAFRGFGFKFYKLCESISGYCTQFKIYVGLDEIAEMYAQHVVMKLAEPLLGKGYTLYLDNWYSSPELFELLKKHNVNAVGTVRKNRKNMPEKFATKINRGEVRTMSCRGVLSLHWRGKKDVYMLSTKHSSAEMIDTGMKRERKGGETENATKPSCLIEYNRGMEGVDKQNQLLACFPTMQKSVGGYKKIFFYMIDMAIYNAYVLYYNTPNSLKRTIENFQLSIADGMLAGSTLPNYHIRGRPAHANCPTRLEAKHWAHFPEHIPATEKKQHPAKRCHVCTQYNIRSETTWQCKKCQIPLHLPECFEKYHTLEHY